MELYQVLITGATIAMSTFMVKAHSDVRPEWRLLECSTYCTVKMAITRA